MNSNPMAGHSATVLQPGQHLTRSLSRPFPDTPEGDRLLRSTGSKFQDAHTHGVSFLGDVWQPRTRQWSPSSHGNLHPFPYGQPWHQSNSCLPKGVAGYDRGASYHVNFPDSVVEPCSEAFGTVTEASATVPWRLTIRAEAGGGTATAPSAQEARAGARGNAGKASLPVWGAAATSSMTTSPMSESPVATSPVAAPPVPTLPMAASPAVETLAQEKNGPAGQLVESTGVRGRGGGATGQVVERTAIRESAGGESREQKMAAKAVMAAAGPHWQQVLKEIAAGQKVMIAQTAPAVRVAIAEEVGLAPGAVLPGQLVAALRELGFQYVFDTTMAADLCIMEEGHELLERIEGAEGAGPLPLLTSCCPGWVALVEKCYPELIPYLSTCKSPHLMLGAVLKGFYAPEVLGRLPEEASVTSVMPCVRKQGEADRPWHAAEGGVRDVDHVITTVELGKLLREKGIDIATLPDSNYDFPYGAQSGTGVMFGSSGGVMEAALRTVGTVVTGHSLLEEKGLQLQPVRGLDGIKVATIKMVPVPGAPLYRPSMAGEELELRVAVANGLGNAKKLLKEVEEGNVVYHFIEVMACPGGCIGGGGQPRTKDHSILKLRQEAVYDLDRHAHIRGSHVNPAVAAFYRDFLGHPLSDKAKALLHTHYVAGGYGANTEHVECDIPRRSMWITPFKFILSPHTKEVEYGT